MAQPINARTTKCHPPNEMLAYLLNLEQGVSLGRLFFAHLFPGSLVLQPEQPF